MTDHEKYLLAIQLADAVARVADIHYALSQRLAEAALRLLGETQK